MLKSYVNPVEQQEATRQVPRLMVEGLLLGGVGLGVLALIFEIAADAFSVAAYQTRLYSPVGPVILGHCPGL
jgi:hypothetical protein